MSKHDVTFPIADPQEILKLRAGDEVTVQGHIIGIRDRTQIRIFDQGVEPPMDLSGAFLLHTAPNVRKVEPSNEHPAGFAPVCIGTTTSQRMERFTRPLMERQGVRLVIGKGGLGDASRAAFQEIGGAYLAIVGGAAALETTWITAIEDVDLAELDPECLWRFAIKGFGPILVAMDAHGGSLYDKVRETAESRRAAALAAMGVGQ